MNQSFGYMSASGYYSSVLSPISRLPYLDFDSFSSFNVGECQCKNCRLGCCAPKTDVSQKSECKLELEPEECVSIANDKKLKSVLKKINTKIADLVDDYLNNDEGRWTTCLMNKWSLSDCVTGCHNGELGDKELRSPGKKLFNFHPHMIHFSAYTILEMVRRMDYALFNYPFNSFEELFSKVAWLAGRTNENSQFPYVYDFGRVAIYDTALRIGFHLKRKAQNDFGDTIDKNGVRHLNYNIRVLPKEYVYLHAGAMDGALALAELGVLKTTQPDGKEIEIGSTVPVSIFPRCIISRIKQPYQIEDFLCVKHNQLEAMAEQIKRNK